MHNLNTEHQIPVISILILTFQQLSAQSAIQSSTRLCQGRLLQLSVAYTPFTAVVNTARQMPAHLNFMNYAHIWPVL